MSKIVIKNLEKSFGDNKVINKFNIDIKDGEFIVLVGPSGCGKSTLLRMVSGLESIDQGEIFLDTKLINNLFIINFDNIHFWRTNKLRNKNVIGIIINFIWCSKLFNNSFI